VTEVDHYQLLGIEPEASQDDIRAAYRRRSRELHPDRNRATDANAQMAAVNVAYGVLSDPRARERYDLARPRKVIRMRTRPAVPPASGRGSLQPERFPDWYEFLGLRVDASSAEVLVASRMLGAQLRAAGYATEVEDRLLGHLRQATEWLTTSRLREVYDAAWAGTPPPAGEHAHLHADYYSFIGVRPTASAERIADRITAISNRVRSGSLEARDLNEAWRVVRDSERRAAYDREIGIAETAAR
jgi:curved DNA-binding protein CbpA